MENMDIGSVGKMRPSERPVAAPQRKATSEGSSTPTQDRVQISDEGTFASALMAEISKMPESRTEVVQDVLQKVRGGNYPPPALIDGLVKLMGDTLKTEGE